MRHRFVAASLLLASVGVTPRLLAQNQVLFHGLPTVGVHVVGVTPTAAALGIDSVELRQRTEVRLRAAGLVVATKSDLREWAETPRLVVNVGFFTTRDSSAVFSVLLELLERVQLVRNGLETHAVGWSERVIGAAPVANSAGATRDAVDRLVEIFLAERRRAVVDPKPAIGP